MATYTSNAADSKIRPRAVHAGVNSRVGIYSLAASLSAGDIILGPKIPDEARILDSWVWLDPSAGAEIAVALGDGGSRNRFMSTQQASDGADYLKRANKNLGYQYTFSDDASFNARFDTVDAHIGGVSDVSAVGHVAIGVLYEMP